MQHPQGEVSKFNGRIKKSSFCFFTTKYTKDGHKDLNIQTILLCEPCAVFVSLVVKINEKFYRKVRKYKYLELKPLRSLRKSLRTLR